MFKTILKNLKHKARVAHSVVREAAKNVTRSGHWSTVRKTYLKEHPLCAACGGKQHPQIHHRIPFHTKPDLELDPTNLITLCMGDGKDGLGFECHLRLGHGSNFKMVNANVTVDAAEVLLLRQRIAAVEAKAEQNRIPNQPTASP